MCLTAAVHRRALLKRWLCSHGACSVVYLHCIDNELRKETNLEPPS